MKKGDILVCLAILLCAVLLWCAQLNRNFGSTAEIYLGGSLYATYDLFSDQTVTVSSQYGTNVIQVKDGSVWVSESSCIDKNEVLQGKISHTGESLICLPNRLVIRIAGKEVVDSVSY